jgi:hypothetical protein
MNVRRIILIGFSARQIPMGWSLWARLQRKPPVPAPAANPSPELGHA